MIRSARLLCFFLLFSMSCFSQNLQLHGLIYDSTTNEPLIGVKIKIDNHLNAITDINGKYKIDLEAGKHQLKLSFVGYEDLFSEIDLSSNTEFNFSLKEISSELDVVVVSASRFKQKLEEVTVSVDVINARIIENKNCVTLSYLKIGSLS